MTRPSFRVYFVPHASGHLTGILLRPWADPFAGPLPSAFAATEAEVLEALELELARREDAALDPPSSYLWTSEVEVHRVSVEIHPQAVVAHRPVVGSRIIPLPVQFASSPLPGGGHRLILPRFGWSFVVEELSIAAEVLRSAITTAMLGREPRLLYDFRSEGPEYVREWSPKLAVKLEGKRAADASADDYPTLRGVADEWVERALRGKAPRTVGLERLADEHAALATFDPPPSILLVGPPGVGKTAWVRQLAKHLSKRSGRRRRLWATSQARIVAGMVYVGMWQERALKIVSELTHEGDFLYVDRLVGLMAEQPDGASLGEVFLPAMLSKEISLVAEASERELERCRRRAPSLVGAFRVIRLSEPAPAELVPLLLDYHARGPTQLTIHPAAMRRIVGHLESFERATAFPGKAMSFLDWVAAEHGPGRAETLYPRDASALFARHSGLPVELVSDEHPLGTDEIAQALGRDLVGQEDAVRTAAGVIARYKAGLHGPDRPIASLFFVGPTGVGKTELAKHLARYLFGSEDRMIRLDMSEYALPGSAARLSELGARSLAERVRERPLSVVLLDEIEKAAPEVFDVLLGVLGEGRLADPLGREVDFRGALVIMTSNLGADEAETMGFGAAPRRDYSGAVRRHFRPELFARLDHVVSFGPLDPSDVLRIVDLTIARLAERSGLVRRKLTLDVAPKARQLLARKGYDPSRGARPLLRLVEETVVAPVAVRMAADPEFRERKVEVLARTSQAYLRLGEAERREVVVIDD